MAADWSSGLPCELLRFVALRLDFFPDLSAFACTCSSWRSSALGLVDDDGTDLYSLRRRSNPPILIHLPAATSENEEKDRTYIAPAVDSGSSIRLYSPFHGRTFKLRLPEDEGGRRRRLKLCPSSTTCPGWLILLDSEVHCLDSEIVLLHPFSMESLHLPPLRSYIAAQEEGNPKFDERYAWRHFYTSLVKMAVVVSDPAAAAGYRAVIAIVGYFNTLALFKAGDTEWTDLPGTNNVVGGDDMYMIQGFESVVGFGPGLVCDMEGADGAFLAYDVGSDSTAAIIIPRPLLNRWSKMLFAESMGELVVLQLDPSWWTWNNMHHLCGRALFFGRKSCISLPCGGGLPWKPDCIYFMDEDGIGIGSNENRGQEHGEGGEEACSNSIKKKSTKWCLDLGFFNIKDGTLHSFSVHDI